MCSFLCEGWQNETSFLSFLKFYDKKYIFPQHWEAILAQSLILKICFLFTCFHQCCPATVFDETKDQKIIRRDMKDSWNSALDLLVYSKSAIHSTKVPTGPTGKSGPPQKVDPFFRNFSGWNEPIHWVLDGNFRKFWLNGSRPKCPIKWNSGPQIQNTSP